MPVCPSCLHVPTNLSARYCEACGAVIAASKADDGEPFEPDTDLDLPALSATVTSRVDDLIATSEMGASPSRPDLDDVAEPQALAAIHRSDAALRARRLALAAPVDPRLWHPWERVHPMPARLRVGERDWRRLDELDVADPRSVARLGFEVRDAGEVAKEEGEGSYPQGGVVLGRGLRHRGGTAVMVVPGLLPGAPLVVVRQCLAVGSEAAELHVGGDKVYDVRAFEVDEQHVWRNRVAVVPAGQILAEAVELRFVDRGSNPGLSWFKVGFYQPQ